MPNHVFANRRFGDRDAELQEFAVNSRRSPAHIVSAQSPNQFTRFFWNTRPTRLSMPDLPSPVPAETPPVPFNNGSGLHNPEGFTPSRPESGQRDPETPIRRLQLGLRISVAEARRSGVGGQEFRFVDRPYCENTLERTSETTTISPAWPEQPTSQPQWFQ